MDALPGAGGGAERLRLLLLALAGEGLLAALGLAVVWLRSGRARVPVGDLAPSVVLGCAVALAFAAGLHVVLRYAPDLWPVSALRRTYRDVLRPIFASSGAIDLIAISVAAGTGEELLFRAGLQPLLGLVATSALFGAVHVFSRDSIPLGLWAMAAGAVFGWLMNLTGGLVAPVVAHTVYDALALAYIRWGPVNRAL